jgi:hypothetical protein
MRRRTLSVFLLGTSFAVLLASCGGGSAGSSTASTTTATTTERTSSRGPGGTGAKAPSREVQAAESTLASFFEARAKEDWKAACFLLSSSVRSQLEELAKGIGGKAKGCASVLAMSSKGETAVGLASPLTHALTSLRVRGNDAFALWVGPRGQKYAMPMVREGGGWRPAEVAPVPDPSGGEP